MRDLGGWPADGGRVRFGCVFRGAALSALTEADEAVLSGLRVRTVCDLRGVAESAAAPTRLVGAMIHSLPIEPLVAASLRDIAATHGARGEDVPVLMRRAYVAYALEWGHRYRAMFDLLVDGPGAFLLHCSAGKDRTGFGAALILTALGVPREAVMEDYLASNRLWRRDADVAAGCRRRSRRSCCWCAPSCWKRRWRRSMRRTAGSTAMPKRNWDWMRENGTGCGTS